MTTGLLSMPSSAEAQPDDPRGSATTAPRLRGRSGSGAGPAVPSAPDEAEDSPRWWGSRLESWASRFDSNLPSAVGDQPSPSNAFSAALAAVQRVLRSDASVDLWQSSARALRAATVQEAHRARRHAAMALLLADVLSFTQPTDLRDGAAARGALQRAWEVLAQPFVSTDAERAVTRELARTGWQLTLPYRGWLADD